jgi:TolB-like protein
MEKAYIEGQITGVSKIEYLAINNIPVLHRKGQVIFFNHLAELRQGENSIKIEARDEAGNTTVRRISILRQIPMALELDERLSLTILPFEQKGAVSAASTVFQDYLINSLVSQKRFRIVERNRLDAVLEEQKLSLTDLVDKSTALRLGKLVAAKSIVTGSIIETSNGIEVVARMIDTETSEVLATEDVYNEVKEIAALSSLAEGIAIKFHREFPLVDGSVIQQERSYILTDLGKDKVSIQRRLIVYREKPIKHPQTGKILGSDNTIIAHARVTQVMPERSRADLPSGENFSINPMDKVITE